MGTSVVSYWEKPSPLLHAPRGGGFLLVKKRVPVHAGGFFNRIVLAGKV
jgi:hypothetical protein